ncbi:MAG: hypothetical protein K0S01_1130 [Herbinix sp.]|nr:hypothetical protein [Herbinix sp.]
MKIREKYQVKYNNESSSITSRLINAIRGIVTILNINTIRTKLILSFLVPIVFIIILGIVSYNKAAEGIRDSYEHSTKQAIHMTSKYLQLGLNSVVSLSTQYRVDENIKMYFQGAYKDDLFLYSTNNKDIKNSIITKEATEDFISGISFLSDEVESITTASSVEDGSVSEFLKTDIGQIVNKTNSIAWLGSNTYLDEKLGVGPQNYALRLIGTVMGSDSLIVIDIDDEAVRNILKDTEFEKTGIIRLVTADGKEILPGDVSSDLDLTFVGQDFYQDAIDSEQSDNADYVDYKGERYLFIYSKVGETGAMICSLIPNSTILSQADSILKITVFIVLIACIIAVMTGAIISNGIGKTIKYIITKLKKASEGDLTINISTKRHDEFLILIDELNNTFTNMKNLISNVKILSGDVSKTSDNVAITSEDFVKTTGDISYAMNEIEKGIIQQAKDAEECLMQMDNLSSKITLLGDNTSKIERITETTKTSINKGTIATSNLNEQTKSTKEITTIIVKEIESLAEKSKTIDSIINVINEISNQTNLLSLNASIEAARAGEVGKGFAVVAGEIRSLADQTRKSVNDIKHIIKSIQENTKNAVVTAKKVEDVMHLQDRAVENTTTSYLIINESVDNLMIHLQNTIENVSSIEDSRVSTLGAIENISAVLQEIVASTNVVNQISGNQLVSVETLNHWASNLNRNSEYLVQEVQKFTV